MSYKAVGITLQMVSSYKTVDDSPSPWGERAGVRASVFSTAPFRLRRIPDLNCRTSLILRLTSIHWRFTLFFIHLVPLLSRVLTGGHLSGLFLNPFILFPKMAT